MNRAISWARGLFLLATIAAVFAVSGYSFVLMSQRQWRWQDTFQARVQFRKIAGLAAGDGVRIQGSPVGAVEAIEMPIKPGDPVTVVLRIDSRMKSLIRADAVASIEAQGVVGSKVIEITPGSSDHPELAPDQFLRSQTPIEVADLLAQADQSFRRLNKVADTADRSLGEINAIASSIRSGEGSLGKLLKEDVAHDRLIAVAEKSERTLGELEDNLKALKSTWPLSRYFDNRAYTDLNRLLYRPGAKPSPSWYSNQDLFQPSMALLSPEGKQRLDQFAGWFKQAALSQTEVVIVVTADPDQKADQAAILAEDQAKAVLGYLKDKHSIHKAGIFSSRKIASVGLGAEALDSLMELDKSKGLPSRPIGIILFTSEG